MGRRPSSKKKNKKKSGTRNKIRWPRTRPWITISILSVLVIISLAVLFLLKGEKKEAALPPAEIKKTIPLPAEPQKEPSVKEPLTKKPSSVVEKKESLYQIAIVIDDLGNNKEMFNRLLNMNLSFSFSVLPNQDYSLYISRKVRNKKYDLLLHLPMEPEDNEKIKGEGFIMSDMTPNEMLKQLNNDLKAVPNVIGVNNHMGSFLTQDRKAMAVVLGEIKRKGLFFVDSRTTSKTVAYDVARKLGLKSAMRDVFLDDIEDEKEIIKQIELLINTARKEGRAIAIGHPRPSTIAALEKMLPALKSNGIEVVPVSRLVN